MKDRVVASISRWIVDGSVVLTNTVVFIVIVNLALSVYLDVAGPSAKPVEPSAEERGDAAIARYGMDLLRRVYAGKSDARIRALMRGQAMLETAYEPFAEFRSPAGAKGGMTVHEAGFRLIGANQGPWPPDPAALNVFVFGGSTTLGGGVEDGETVPAYLQKVLRSATGRESINVYNFGVGAAVSSQEVIYFQNQLRYGNVPDVVVFLDGMNDFFFWEGFTAASGFYRDSMTTIRSLNAQLGRDHGFLWHLSELVHALPMAKLAQRVSAQREPAAVSSVAAAPVTDPLLAEPQRLAKVIDRYLVNRDIAAGVARRLGIEALFAWQPGPLYKYDTRFHAFAVPERHQLSKYGYPLMARLVAEHPLGPDFVWCADIQEALHEPLYVDAVHYTPAMSERVAQCIARGLVDSGAFARAWAKVEAGRATPVTARALVAPRRERAVAELFGAGAQNQALRVQRTAGEASPECRLIDESANVASIFEDIPLDPRERTGTYRVSLRVRAGTSSHSQLMLQFLSAGDRAETYQVGFNPRAMQLVGGRGVAALEPAPDGWYRLDLSAPAGGAERARVHVIPSDESAEATGDLVLGGGTLWVEQQASSSSSLE